jgi:crotonobetainyl-CoA:carnitine CoA-transferase CaiB-like acyl-CoA transferase
MVVGDLGADVIKIEGPEGDPVRGLAPPRFGDDATYYLAVNRHRRNVVADLRDANDFAAVGKLVEQADAVVENFLPNQLRALNIDKLKALNPDCVWISITPASSGGPVANDPSFDLLAQARSGIMGVTGTAEGEPTKIGAPIADVLSGLYGAVGLLAGLFAKLSGKPGRHFEAPLLESLMSGLVNQAQGYLATGVNPMRLGNDHPSIAPYGPVKTKDGYMLLAVGTDSQYEKLVTALASPELAAHVEWKLNDNRVTELTQLRSVLNSIFEKHTTDEWLQKLDQSGVPMSPILDVAGAFAQRQIADGDFLGTMSTPGGEVQAMRTPLLIDGKRPEIRSGPRRQGEDTEEILGS